MKQSQVSYTMIDLPACEGAPRCDFVVECDSVLAQVIGSRVLLTLEGARRVDARRPARSFLTKRQAAELLGVSARTVEGWMTAKRNPLPCFRVGRGVRFVQEEVESWAQNGASCTAKNAAKRLAGRSEGPRLCVL